MSIKACVFDAYGTLFDVDAAARRLAEEAGAGAFAERWREVSGLWRLKQLHYSWLCAAAETYADFWELTQGALDHALETYGLADAALRERLLGLYWELDAFPDVADGLAALRRDGLTTAILSMASPGMLEGAIGRAGIGDLLDRVISGEEARALKPRRQVYELALDRLRIAPGEMLFVSGNCWDASAATRLGLVTVWINRRGEAPDRLPWTPVHVVEDMAALPAVARQG